MTCSTSCWRCTGSMLRLQSSDRQMFRRLYTPTWRYVKCPWAGSPCRRGREAVVGRSVEHRAQQGAEADAAGGGLRRVLNDDMEGRVLVGQNGVENNGGRFDVERQPFGVQQFHNGLHMAKGARGKVLKAPLHRHEPLLAFGLRGAEANGGVWACGRHGEGQGGGVRLKELLVEHNACFYGHKQGEAEHKEAKRAMEFWPPRGGRFR